MIKEIIVAAFFLSISPACLASNANWDAGNEAFAIGDYPSALRHFEAALNNGLSGPAVHYNLAVCNFKLGKLDDAATRFQLIADRYPAMRGLAEYNLGLVAQRSGERDVAVGHFLNAHRFSPDDRTLRILASHRLRDLEPEMRMASKWSGAVGIRAGFDDNVTLRDETGLPSTIETASPVTDLFASIRGPFNGKSGFRFAGRIYAIKNVDAGDFDQSGLYGGAMYDWRQGDWRIQLGLHGSTGSLGGDSFDRKFGADLNALRYLNQNAEVSLTYVYDDVQEGDSRFAGIAGSRQQIQARYRWYDGDRRFAVRYRHETNSRLSADVSPARSLLSAVYRYQPDSGLGYEGGITFRNSRYDDMLTPRDEDLITINVAATWALTQRWMLVLDYRHSSNDSSDPLFSYDRNVITVGALKLF